MQCQKIFSWEGEREGEREGEGEREREREGEREGECRCMQKVHVPSRVLYVLMKFWTEENSQIQQYIKPVLILYCVIVFYTLL